MRMFFVLFVSVSTVLATTDGLLTKVDGEWIVQQVVEVEGQSADELFAAIEDLVGEFASDEEDAIKYVNRESRKIRAAMCMKIPKVEGTGLSGSAAKGDHLCFDLVVETRDGRYRYTMENISRRYEPTKAHRAFEKQSCLKDKYIKKKSCQKVLTIYEATLALFSIGLKDKLDKSAVNEDW